MTGHLIPARLTRMQAKRRSPRRIIRGALQWFIPGIGIKRWMLAILAGITMLGVGSGLFLLDLYRTESTNAAFLAFLRVASLQFAPRLIRVLVFAALGAGLVAYSMWRLSRTLLRPFLRPGEALVDQLTTFNKLHSGPRVVAIGGGHGMATLLRGLKQETRNITAVVTVADDGGSSGRLRQGLGIPPPGDIRNCLAALSNDEALITQLFQYRFSGMADLDGHSFGNLFITALSDLTGSFEEAVAESGRALAVSGRVLPSTLHSVRLLADMQLPQTGDEVRVSGESTIPTMNGKVRRVWLDPDDPPAFPPAVQAMLTADLIVVGPGSIFTSLLPNLLVPDIAASLRSSTALKVYVCNVATQPGETDAFSVEDHLKALEDHVGPNLFDVIVCNGRYHGELSAASQWVRAEGLDLRDGRWFRADLTDSDRPWRHDPAKLTRVLMEILYAQTAG